MPTAEEKKLLKQIEKEYIKKGRSKEDAQRIARAVVFRKLRKSFRKKGGKK